MKPVIELLLGGWDGPLGWPALLACVVLAVVGWLLRLVEKHLGNRSEPKPGLEPPLAGWTMEEVLGNLKLLDPDELREQVLKAGLKCGPITSTTRSIFEKKLARALLEQRGADFETLHSSNGVCTAPSVKSAYCPEDRDFGYNVGVNPPAEETTSLLNAAAPLNFVDEARASGQILSSDSSVFYAVCPVYEDSLTRNEKIHIYSDIKEALQVTKMLKGSRFKAFHSREDAEKFARGICDYFPSPCKTSLPLSPVKPSSPLLRDGVSSPETDCLNREKANSFKSPRTQDLTSKLRKAVEKGDMTTFSDLIWSNPRYLIGSGDNPTVVQEGCRYNVMHVAAKENQSSISQLLLDTLENPEFMKLMYPDDDDVMLQKRIRYIVDLYLNTPDKMAFDTPLHFACKFGSAEVVSVLCSHPDIIKNRRNKYNQTPEEIICERSKSKSPELKARIREYLQGHVYVPLLRAEDNSSFPVIGIPWSPEQPDLLSQPRFCGSPKDPLLAVRAFAGPMSPSKAEDFRRTWKTPPRERAGVFHNVRKTDPERGEERVGRELAHELDVPWVEYWEFLGCFTDLSSQEGLTKLEDYLSKKEKNEQMVVDHDHEICNKYKTPSPAGQGKKFCNSISVGAFLDDDEDLTLEEIKNRQNAALKNSFSAETIGTPECIMDTTPLSSIPQKDGSTHDNGSPLRDDHVASLDHRHAQSFEEGMRSPVSNLLAEFEKLSLSELKQESKESHSPPDTCTSIHKLSRMTLHDDEPSGSEMRTESCGLSHGEQMLIGSHIEGKPSLDDEQISYSCSGFPAHHLIMETPPKHQSHRATFLLGKEPSKLDSDVLAAIENVEINAQKYPSISRWIKAILSYPSSERQSWPSPAVLSGRSKNHIFGSNSPGGHGFSTPGRSSPLPGSPGKYMNTSDYSSPGRYSPAYASHIQLLRLRHFSDHTVL